MKKTGKKILITAVAFGIIFIFFPYLPGTGEMRMVEAHRGSSHHEERHRAGGGADGYYYCGGHEAHQHTGGVCPYQDYYCGGHEAHQHTGGVCPYQDYYCDGHEAHQHTGGVCPYQDYYCDGHEAHQHTGGVCPYQDYYCDGHEAHRHVDGVCPYAAGSAKAASANGQGTFSADVIRELQRGLCDAGYDCGKADGVWGKRSKAALKSYQADHSMTEDGWMSDEILKEFGIKQ